MLVPSSFWQAAAEKAAAEKVEMELRQAITDASFAMSTAQLEAALLRGQQAELPTELLGEAVRKMADERTRRLEKELRPICQAAGQPGAERSLAESGQGVSELAALGVAELKALSGLPIADVIVLQRELTKCAQAAEAAEAAAEVAEAARRAEAAEAKKAELRAAAAAAQRESERQRDAQKAALRARGEKVREALETRMVNMLTALGCDVSVTPGAGDTYTHTSVLACSFTYQFASASARTLYAYAHD